MSVEILHKLDSDMHTGFLLPLALDRSSLSWIPDVGAIGEQ